MLLLKGGTRRWSRKSKNKLKHLKHLQGISNQLKNYLTTIKPKKASKEEIFEEKIEEAIETFTS